MTAPNSRALAARSIRESPAVRAAVTICALTLATLGILETRLHALHHVILTRRATDYATIPSPGNLRLFSLGHREWAADLLWTSGLVYFGETLVNHQQQRFLQRYIDTIEDVDPRFRQAYFWGATVSMYNGRSIDRESVENSIHHLERGLRQFPNDGEMLYQLGFNYFFELGRHVDNPEEKAELRRRGAEYLRRASALGHGTPWMALAAVEALQLAGLHDSALAELRNLMVRTDDERVRERIASRIRDLLGEGAQQDPFLEEVRRVDVERRAWFPYVAPVLYMFIGPPVRGIATGTPAAHGEASAGIPRVAGETAGASDASAPDRD